MRRSLNQAKLAATLGISIISVAALSTHFVWADVTANTGIVDNSILGNNSMQAEDTGVAINGPVQDSNVNNNQNENNISSSNQNANIVQPVMIAPNSSGGGRGGSAALVLPRNPLPMPNASLGRSNFAMQFGVNNNPGMAALTGGDTALGWFAQAGVTIPFGKIPDIYRNQNSSKLDDIRQKQLDNRRNVFGGVQPAPTIPSQSDQKVRGRIVGLSAYNRTSIPSAKIGAESLSSSSFLDHVSIPQPKVLALTPAEVFTRPLNTGEKIGAIEVGKEYPYLGHTRSGWVKVLLPNGSEGWTSTNFEYIKYDFTEIDSLAVDPQMEQKSASQKTRTQKKALASKS